jgi:anti-anti-sigma regulatory factor
MEWFWRLASQPVRLFRRYSSNLIFLAMMLVRLIGIRMLPAGRVVTLDALPEPAIPLPPLSSLDVAAEFCARHEAAAREKGLALDLSGSRWLNSVELGAIVQLSRAARQGGRSLTLVASAPACGACCASTAWIGSSRFRKRRKPGPPASPIPAPPRGPRWLDEGEQCRVVLPDQFECGEAWRAQEEAERRAAAGKLRRVVVDGRRLRYIDSSGLHFLKNGPAVPGRHPGRGDERAIVSGAGARPAPARRARSIPADASGPG